VSDKARVLALSAGGEIAGYGQTAIGLSQKPGIVDLHGALACERPNLSQMLLQSHRYTLSIELTNHKVCERL